MSWVQVAKKSNIETASTTSSKKKRTEIINAPDISHLPSADDTIDHKYNLKVMDMEERLQEYLSYNGLDTLLLVNLKPGDLQEFAKSTSSEYTTLSYRYKRKVKAIYKNSKVIYRTVDESDSN